MDYLLSVNDSDSATATDLSNANTVDDVAVAASPLLDNSEVEDMLQKMKSKDTDVYHRVMEIPVSPTEEDDGSLSCIGEDFFLRIEDKITNNSRKSDDELWNGYYKDLAVSVDVYHLCMMNDTINSHHLHMNVFSCVSLIQYPRTIRRYTNIAMCHVHIKLLAHG